ncbi:NADH-quinone oxidoreductase subunit C [Verrucomicrobiota bacterium sgz303538]
MATPKFSADVAALDSKFKVLKKVEFRGETTLYVELEAIHEICQFAKEQLGYTFLLDLSGVDNFGEDPRFEVVYELYHFERGDHLRLKISVSEDELEVPTVSDIWATADWHERECFDMYGIRFRGHPDLRRILMWEGYPFFPLRKDFPLAGRPSEMPDVAFSRSAPLEGGPFVTVPSTATVKDREPRSRQIE